jgi:streptomycin 6-kinase
VLRVRLDDGRSAIVKDLTPIGTEDELRGADYLAWRDGRGAVRLLAREGTTLLLEDAGSESLLDRFEELGDQAATDVLVGVVVALHAPGPSAVPAALQPLGERFVSLFEQADAGRDPLIVEGARIAGRLLADPRDVRPLHGDLHHANVHRSARGWLALDPKGLIGDAVYDVANLFYNPLDRHDLRRDADRIRSMALTAAARMDREAEDVLAWAFADMCLNASWHFEDGNADRAAQDLEIARSMRRVLWSLGFDPERPLG